MKKPPVVVILLLIASQLSLPPRADACSFALTLWDYVEEADWIAVARVRRIEVDASAGDPTFGNSEEHEVAVLEALDVWKGSPETEVRVDLLPNTPPPYAEGDVLLVFLQRGETRARRLDPGNLPDSIDGLMELGLDETEAASVLEELAEQRQRTERFAAWSAGRWLQVSDRPLPESEAERSALEKIVRAAASLQADGEVSPEDKREWLVSVIAQRAFREEALYSLLGHERDLTDAQLARIASAFAEEPAVDASDVSMLQLLRRYPGSEVDATAAAVIEAALRMPCIPNWATPMVVAVLDRYGDDFSERIGRDDRDPSGRLIYMEGMHDTLPTIWAVARRDLGIPEVAPAQPPSPSSHAWDPYSFE